MIGKRLYDRVMCLEEFNPLYRKSPAASMNGKSIAETWKGKLAGAQVFEISSVAEYFYAGTDQEEWDVFDDFPCVMPPYGELWMEYVVPPVIRSNGAVKDTVCRGLKVGVFAYTHETVKPDGEKLRIQGMTVFLENFGKILGPSMTSCWQINEQGKASSLSQTPGNVLYVGAGAEQDEQDIDIQQKYMTFCYPALLAVSFLNCRNVEIVDHQPDSGMAKAHQKKHGRQLTKFKTLEISQVKKVLQSASAASGGDLKVALHLCRGHFKNYNERPLFGKHKGMYWWGPAIRGTGPAAVIKDYSIKGDGNGKGA